MRFGVHHVFIVIGAALLAGAALWYEFGVRRPATWPRADAEVVSSRVINPEGPNDYRPEIVLRYEIGGSVRETAIVPSWKSSSYDMVRSHVDQYPTGTRLTVAVNPNDPSDARYEIGVTAMNLLGPGVLLFLAVVFAGIGVIAGRWQPGRRRPVSETGDYEQAGTGAHDHGILVARRVGMAFVAIGIVLIGIGAVLVRGDAAVLSEWPIIDGTVVASRVVNAGSTSSSGSRGSRALFDAEVTFRYVVDGRTYENRTAYGTRTTDRSAAEERAAFYAPGTTHAIRVMPQDPNIIRFDLDNPINAYWLSGAIMLMGVVFAGLGGAVWRFARAGVPAPKTPEQIFQEDDEADRFKPRV